MNPASVKYLNRQRMFPKLRQWTLGATVDLGFAFCIWFVSGFYVSLSLVFSACYHWWICLLVWLFSSFFNFFFIYFFPLVSLFVTVYAYVSLCGFVCLGLLLPFVLGFWLFFFLLLFLFMSVCVYVTLCDFVSFAFTIRFGVLTGFFFFFSPFFSSFSFKPWGWQGLGATAGCQAWASKVGEPSPGHWTTRDLPAPRNINWWELSQRSPPQR